MAAKLSTGSRFESWCKRDSLGDKLSPLTDSNNRTLIMAGHLFDHGGNT